jgi:hypothetical protein
MTTTLSGDVIGMGVAGQQDLDVAHLEAERLDRRTNQRNGFLEAAVDQDVPVVRRDQIRRQRLRADVIHIADDSMRRKRVVGNRRNCEDQREDQCFQEQVCHVCITSATVQKEMRPQEWPQ